MTTSTTDEEAATAGTASQEQKPEKKAKAAPQKPRVAPAKAKSGTKTTPAKKAPRAKKTTQQAKPPEAAREGSKTAKVLDLLKRPDGATLKDIMKATGWQPHSVRGFISGTLGKKRGLTVASTKREDGERLYSVAK